MITVRQFLWLVVCPVVLATCESKRESKKLAEIMENLQKLGGLRPSICLKDAEKMKIEYPKPLKECKQWTVLVMGLSFRSAAELFSNNTTNTTWNAHALRRLQHLLGQQSDCYKHIFPIVDSGEDVKKWNSVWTDLSGFLVEKNFSSCAWESVRPVVLRVMRTFFKFKTKCVHIPANI